MTRWLVTVAALALATPACGETPREAIVVAYAANPQLAAAPARQDALAETPNRRAPFIGPAGAYGQGGRIADDRVRRYDASV